MESIDRALYINLKHRTDRRETTEKQFLGHLPQLERFEAVRAFPGELGCSKSLVTVLEQALEAKWSILLLLEDDLIWNDDDAPKRLQGQLDEMVERGADGVVLTTFRGPDFKATPLDSEVFERVLYATDTGATLFTRPGAEEMLRVQRDAVRSYEDTIRRLGLSSKCSHATLHLTTDRVRKRVFDSQTWLVPRTEEEMVVRQPGGFSDLGHAVIDLDAYRSRQRPKPKE